ncbi:MAG: hypothetical protein U0892_03150 [Pirellulales bacterium]
MIGSRTSESRTSGASGLTASKGSSQAETSSTERRLDPDCHASRPPDLGASPNSDSRAGLGFEVGSSSKIGTDRSTLRSAGAGAGGAAFGWGSEGPIPKKLVRVSQEDFFFGAGFSDSTGSAAIGPGTGRAGLAAAVASGFTDAELGAGEGAGAGVVRAAGASTLGAPSLFASDFQ